MFSVFDKDSRILNDSEFLKDEVMYNLIHRIIETENALCISSIDNKMIFAQTPNHNGWFWISNDMEEGEKEKLIESFVDYLGNRDIQGVTGSNQTADLFAKGYAKGKQKQWHVYMEMEAYHCPFVKKNIMTPGEAMVANMEHLEKVAFFLTKFIEEAFGDVVDLESQKKSARKMIESGNVYVWGVEGEIVSMANIAHRSPRHGRINGVFTPVSLRKKGYASALVAEVSSSIIREGLTPMLYADLKNPSANKIYQEIGYTECGKISDIRFT